jgi:hypothetical protein
MEKLSILAFCFLFTAFAAFPQEGPSQGESPAEDLDSLFEEEAMIEEAPEEPSGTAPEEGFLLSKGVEWGGSLTSSFTSRWSWIGDDYPRLEDLRDPDKLSRLSLETRLEASLFFDSKPTVDFRVFGKLKTSYPFSSRAEGSDSSQISVPNVQVFELFSDFNWKDVVFFRVGKHTVKWGTGYFFSPADVLNLTPIDPKDAQAEREGPISLRVHLPIDVHNLYLYAISNNISVPHEIALAPKVEFVVGNWEFGAGGFYRRELAPRAVFTLTGPLWGIDLFGEAVVSYGSDKTFVRAVESPNPVVNPLGVETYTRKEEWFFSGSPGFSYLNADLNLSLTGQYLLNGEGYKDPDLLSKATALVGMKAMSAKDLANFGTHYGALSFSLSEILDTGLGFSTLFLSNLSDGSGFFSPTLSYKLFDHAQISFGTRLSYGDVKDEFTLLGRELSLSIGATIGSGRF